MDFRRRRPSAEALAWVERELGVPVVGIRRMTGGIVAAVHRLTVAHAPSGRRELVVLRQYEDERHGDVEREAAVLRQVGGAGLLAPRPLAVAATGAGAGGHPALLMTRVPGRADLSPADPGRWLGQMADMAARIHAAAITIPARDRQPDGDWRLDVPASASRPGLWRTLDRVLAQPAPPFRPCFTHGDFQHFNLLWSRGRLTGVVDWGSAEHGPPDIDAGHCRLNLAVLFSADWAERFRLDYEARAGRRVDPWWDLCALASYNDSWPRFIPVQVDGRAQVDVAGMTSRVEDLLQATLQRL